MIQESKHREKKRTLKDKQLRMPRKLKSKQSGRRLKKDKRKSMTKRKPPKKTKQNLRNSKN
jgi:hypothetical protein